MAGNLGNNNGRLSCRYSKGAAQNQKQQWVVPPTSNSPFLSTMGAGSGTASPMCSVLPLPVGVSTSLAFTRSAVVRHARRALAAPAGSVCGAQGHPMWTLAAAVAGGRRRRGDGGTHVGRDILHRPLARDCAPQLTSQLAGKAGAGNSSRHSHCTSSRKR